MRWDDPGSLVDELVAETGRSTTTDLGVFVMCSVADDERTRRMGAAVERNVPRAGSSGARQGGREGSTSLAGRGISGSRCARSAIAASNCSPRTSAFSVSRRPAGPQAVHCRWLAGLARSHRSWPRVTSAQRAAVAIEEPLGSRGTARASILASGWAATTPPNGARATVERPAPPPALPRAAKRASPRQHATVQRLVAEHVRSRPNGSAGASSNTVQVRQQPGRSARRSSAIRRTGEMQGVDQHRPFGVRPRRPHPPRRRVPDRERSGGTRRTTTTPAAIRQLEVEAGHNTSRSGEPPVASNSFSRTGSPVL